MLFPFCFLLAGELASFAAPTDKSLTFSSISHGKSSFNT